ncbi:hypothetical protein [Kitasatospora cineracea]|uniref:hypothetical protein n=1 Tax=Kitasatospora cineracea TaxID=88074 RepID=UPI003794FA81
MSNTNRRTATTAACVGTGTKVPRSPGLSAPEAVVVIIVVLLGAILVASGLAAPVVLGVLGGTATIAVGIVVSVRANRYLRLAVQEV